MPLVLLWAFLVAPNSKLQAPCSHQLKLKSNDYNGQSSKASCGKSSSTRKVCHWDGNFSHKGDQSCYGSDRSKYNGCNCGFNCRPKQDGKKFFHNKVGYEYSGDIEYGSGNWVASSTLVANHTQNVGREACPRWECLHGFPLAK